MSQALLEWRRLAPLAMLTLSLGGLSACQDAVDAPEPARYTQAIEGGGSGVGFLDPDNPVGFESCLLHYLPCAGYCDPGLVDPGTPGVCCRGDLRSTCYEAGIYSPGDQDNDGVPDNIDHCVFTPDPSNANSDNDPWGDVCDNCDFISNVEQYDIDRDGIGDACDSDRDGDGVDNQLDNCPDKANADQLDTDGDLLGDACDGDIDGDGILNGWDNCDLIPNPQQRNFDGDAEGNVCDDDMDNDGVLNHLDNCPSIPNPDQALWRSGIGEACAHLNVLLERVRVSGGGLTRAEFTPWDTHQVRHAAQEKTLIARASDPPRDQVRHLVFIAAGQQFYQYSCSLTGQRAEYEADFPLTQASKQIRTGHSLAREIFIGGVFDPAETFIGLAVDSRFNFEKLGVDKQNIEDAYYDWLRSQYFDGNIQSIFLAGHSRGGCLVARLARRFQQDYPGLPIIVQLYDPVCAMSELGVDVLTAVDNPLHADITWVGRTTNFTNQYAPPIGFNRTNLRVLNVLSGAPVLLIGVRFLHLLVPVSVLWVGTHVTSFTHTGDPDTLVEQGETWYERYWSDDEHDEVEDQFDEPFGPYTRVGPDHLATACQQLGCQ